MSVLVSVGVASVLPGGQAAPAVLLSSALVVTAGAAAWLRTKQLAQRQALGSRSEQDIRALMLERLRALPESAPERAAGSTSVHRYQHHLRALSEYAAQGPANLAATAIAISTAALLISAWMPAAASIAVMILTALMAAAFARGAGVRHGVGSERATWLPVTAGIIAAAAIALAVTAFALVRGLLLDQIGAATAAASVTLVASFVPQVLDALRLPAALTRREEALAAIGSWLEKPTLLRIAPQAPDLVRGPGRLEFRDAGVFGCLHALTAGAAPGSAIAVTGPDEIGRSTVLALAARLVDPDTGHVYLDGQDLSVHSDESARRLVGLASSRRVPREGTVETELLTGEAPASWVREALGWCEIDDLIDQLPDGSVTQMRDDRLTSGQRFRLSLARALLHRPSVLLIDETLEPLDASAIAALERVMNRFRGTLFLISQSLDHIAIADAIWYLEGGHLVETGPPSELLAFDGPTARLFGLETLAPA